MLRFPRRLCELKIRRIGAAWRNLEMKCPIARRWGQLKLNSHGCSVRHRPLATFVQRYAILADHRTTLSTVNQLERVPAFPVRLAVRGVSPIQPAGQRPEVDGNLR